MLEWKESKNRKPLIIRGARQVGKTWLMKEFGNSYFDLLRKYYYVGGMPEAVFEYVQNFDYSEVCKIQKQILFTYDQDFSKHVPAKEVPRVRAVWNNVLVQLAKENKKFSP